MTTSPRSSNHQKKSRPPATPQKKTEMWGEVPKIPQWGAGIPSWESIKVDSPNQLLQDSKVVSLQLRSAEILVVPPSPGSWNFADLPRWELEKPIWVIGYDVHQ